MAKQTAEREGVDVRLYKVIYQAIEDIEAAINDFAAKVDFPVYKGFPFGHHSKNMVVDFQRQAVIKDNTIIFPECSR